MSSISDEAGYEIRTCRRGISSISDIAGMVAPRRASQTRNPMQPVSQYAKSGEVHIAYQAFGEGPINLVMVPGFVSNIEDYWEQPELARFLARLGGYARVV